MDLGEPPSDEEQARFRFRIRWSGGEVRAEANPLQVPEDSEIHGFARTHIPQLPDQ